MQIEFKTDAGSSAQGSSDPEPVAGQESAASSQTWDPYEVWLMRVRRPRDSNGAAWQSGQAVQRPRARR